MDSIYKPLAPLADFFFAILQFLHQNLGVSWSWSIVLLTVIVRIVLIPLTWRQIKSMRAMQAVQPQIKALQEKYKQDRQLLQQKTMEFYQENKISPFGSCLPLLLQLPVFFGLFIMLNNAGKVDGVGASAGRFVNPVVGWLWIPDITQFSIILMFLYIASQFVASYQTARNSPSQQKMIAYFMPIIVGIFMFIGKWPAGLMIYWFTSNLWTIAQQVVAEKVMPAPVVAAPVPEKVKEKAARTPTKVKAKAASTQPVKKSGGKTSGQKTGTKGKAAGGKSQRPNRGASRSKGPGRT